MNRNYRWAGLVVGIFIVAVTLSSLLNTGCDPCASCSTETKRPTKTVTQTPTPMPTQGQTPSGQGLIGIDPITNVGYVPIYSLSGAAVRRHVRSEIPAATVPGSAQLAVVDLTVGAVSPIITLIELSNSIQPLGVVFSSKTRKIYAEGVAGDASVSIYEIDPATNTVINTIPCPGLTDQGIWGGVRLTRSRTFWSSAGPMISG